MKPRIVFLGSPQFARFILLSLVDHFNVVGVVTQPDRPSGRGQILSSPPVKDTAKELGIPYIQPEKLREEEVYRQLNEWNSDLFVVAAYGKILKQNILDLPKFGCLNVHASLLPRWRGAAPIQASILAGDQETGITIMKMDSGVDTGQILAQRSTLISSMDDYLSLEMRLAIIGAELLIKTIPCFLNGKIRAIAQDDSLSTYAPMIKKEEGRLNWNLPTQILQNKIRALNPWPGTFFETETLIVKVLEGKTSSKKFQQPGDRFIVDNYPAVTTENGSLIITKLQLPGKKPVNGDEFLRGSRWWVRLIHDY